jgi:hypothetical protein
MVAVLLTALFAATGLFAVATISASWHRYGAAVRTLRTALAACEPQREVRVRITEVRVSRSATVLRPAFTATARNRPAALPVAA